MNPTQVSRERNGSGRSRSIQRWGSLLGGSALAFLGLARRSKAGLAMAAGGGLLAYAGSKKSSVRATPHAEASVVVNCSAEEAYRLWKNFEDLPLFMRHLESVTDLGNGRNNWVAFGPMGSRVRWQAEIVSDREGEEIGWRSLPGSDVQVDGSVEFSKATGNRGTVIRATMRYQPPGGALGQTLAKIFGKSPKFLVQNDLRRCKALIETGEIPTTEGQTHGPRDTGTAVARVLNPDQPMRRGAPMKEVLSEKRRVS